MRQRLSLIHIYMRLRPALRRANMKENKITNQLKDKAIWLVLVVLVIAFTIANERFINPNNILTLLRQVSMYGIASIGMTFVILLGDIDLSTGTVISFVNILCAHMMVNMGMNLSLIHILPGEMW